MSDFPILPKKTSDRVKGQKYFVEKTNKFVSWNGKKLVRLCKCGNIPTYNEEGKTPAICCAKCKTETMVNVVSRKCKCGNIPLYNEEGETRPVCCAK